jgi:leucyl aminopeptidase
VTLRRRVKHEISFEQRLANEAKRAQEMAAMMPLGKKRDALLEKARLADLAAHLNGWLTSPELKKSD